MTLTTLVREVFPKVHPGKCHKLTFPTETSPTAADLYSERNLYSETNSIQTQNTIQIVVCGRFFPLSVDLADAVTQPGLAAWGSARHAMTASQRQSSE